MSAHEMAVALGSNAGDRRAALEHALVALGGMGDVVGVSPVYESEARELPAGAEGADHAPYLNAVVRLATDLEPEAVLAACLAAEREVGRDRARARRHGARRLDMDLLLCDRQVRDGRFLRLPHPGLSRRAFVLAPLARAWPDAPHPTGRAWPAPDPGEPLAIVAEQWEGGCRTRPSPPGDDLLGEAARRRRLGRPPLYLFGEVGSTADVLRELAAMGAPHGTAVAAERQRAGRGRHGRGWWAPPYRSLLLSVLVRDGAALGGLLPLFVGLAVVESVEAAGGPSLLLKWPNDVVVADGRKAAGILVERTARGEVLVGVGMNVEAPGDEAPPEVRARAAALGEGAPAPPRALVLRHLTARLGSLAEEARLRGTGTLQARWRERAPMLGRSVAVRAPSGEEVAVGTAAGVAPDGALVVRRPDGGEVSVHAGEVTMSAPRRPGARRSGRTRREG